MNCGWILINTDRLIYTRLTQLWQRQAYFTARHNRILADELWYAMVRGATKPKSFEQREITILWGETKNKYSNIGDPPTTANEYVQNQNTGPIPTAANTLFGMKTSLNEKEKCCSLFLYIWNLLRFILLLLFRNYVCLIISPDLYRFSCGFCFSFFQSSVLSFILNICSSEL